MLDLELVLVETVKILNQLDLPYFVTGGVAVTYYGEPRTTHDVDLVISMRESDVAVLRQELDRDFFIDDESIRAALREQSMFNAVHKDSGFKVDFWLLHDDEFARTRFVRRKLVRVLGVDMYVVSPEDTLITKLDWFKMSDIDKHFSDAEGIYRIQKETLDTDYIARWCATKGLSDLWTRIQEAQT